MSERITNIPVTWSAGVTLAASEIWQCRSGSVLISGSDAGDNDRGIRLVAGAAIEIRGGATVYFRRDTGSAAVIAREAL